MNYFVEEITVMKDGSSAQAITYKESKEDAVSGYHAVMASAWINPAVATCHCEAKNSIGGIYANETYIARGYNEDGQPIKPEPAVEAEA